MIENTPLFPTSFITFYSFKGGVGRSMAMINVAGILAGRGFRVMALDMDLEAPGISYLMRAEAKAPDDGGPGLVDLLTDACDRGEEADLFALDPVAVVEKYSYPYTVPDGIRESEEGLLRIMPAGRMDGDYQQRLDALNLGQLYRDGRGQPLIGVFKDVIKESALFDFVFVDSRTGFSDEAGICTRDLADCLIVVMGLNRQNVEGTSELLRALKGAGINKPLRIVLSPVPTSDDELVDQREKEATAVLSKAYGQKVDLSLQIPYHPRLALTEEPHIFRSRRGYLYDAYMRLYDTVVAMLGLSPDVMKSTIAFLVEEQRFHDAARMATRLSKVDLLGLEVTAFSLTDALAKEGAGALRECLADLLPASSHAMKTIAKALHNRGHPDARLFYTRMLDANPNDISSLHKFALFLKDHLCEFQTAEELFKRALAIEPTNVEILSNYAVLLFRMDRHTDGKAMLVKAQEWEPRGSSPGLDEPFRTYALEKQSSEPGLAELKSLLSMGIRTLDLPHEDLLRQAAEAGHPAPLFLAALAKVIVGDASLETLDAFPEWQNV